MEDLFSLSTLPKHPKQNTTINIAAPESSQPWTATRCHRLLRPLLAHIAALRKDKERRDLIRAGPGPAALNQAKPRRTVLGKRSYPGSDSDYSDKKTCRKYSRKASRRRSSSEHSSTTPKRNVQRQLPQPGNRAPQDVVLPTPFLRRVRNHLPSSPNQAPDELYQEELAQTAGKRCHHSRSCCKTRCAFEVELAGLRPMMDAERHGLYESVFKAFDALLRVTAPRKNQAAGPKSFLAMCLRKVPAYMAALEEWEREEGEENGTKSSLQGAGISFEIYSELETLGAVDGWKHLCLLVRAHGVEIIQDAASEGLLEDPVTDLLIRVCLEYMPATECKGLIDTFVVRQYPKPRSPDDDLFMCPALQPLRILRSCGPSGISFMSGMLADLLADELLPSDWILTTNFISLWPSMVRLITEMKPCGDTVDFVITTLELLCDLATPKKPRGIPQTRLRGKPQTTLISAVAALGSVVLLSEQGSCQLSGNPTTTRAATIRRRMEYVVRTCSAKLKRRKKGGRKLGTYLLALCSFLSLEADSASAAMVEASWKGVQNCRGNEALMLQYDATTALMSAIARYCSRGTGMAPNVHMSQFCDKLETLQLPGGAMRNMRVDAGFRLAEYTGDLRDLAYAETLRAMAALCSTPEQTRGKKASSFSGIRWDDGISEWVAATPGTDLIPAARMPRLRSSERIRGLVESEEDAGRSTPETDESDPGFSADDESEEMSETHEDDSLSPDTEVSPGPLSGEEGERVSASEPEEESAAEPEEEPAAKPEKESVSKPESEPAFQPEPESDSESESEAELAPAPKPALKPALKAASQTTSQTTSQPELQPPPPPPTTKTSPAPPAGGFLAARPRRLSRRLTITRASDELAFDNDTKPGNKNGSRRENWLSRKKPSRFRPAAVPVAPTATTTTTAGSSKDKGKGKKVLARKEKRVARASLVYLQSVQSVPSGKRSAAAAAVGAGGYDGESDDELSIL